MNDHREHDEDDPKGRFPREPAAARQWRWSVMYETATIQSGTAPSRAEALLIATNVHDSYVIKGLNPDALAYHVEVLP